MGGGYNLNNLVRIVKLGEIGRVCMCKRILKSQTSSIGDVPFYKIGTFGGEADAYISQQLYEEYKAKYSYPKIGDVLISAAGTIGRTVIFDGAPAYFQDSNIVWIDNDEKVVLNKYLFYCYQLKPWQVSSGGTISRLYNENISRTEIPVPPLEVQKRIVKVLDNFDAICSDLGIGLPAEIEKRQQQYEFYRDKLLTFGTGSATIFTDRQTDRQTGLIRLLQYVYGFALVRLGDVAEYSCDRIEAKTLTESTYVGVDNLLPERQGKTVSAYVPTEGRCIRFDVGDVLVGNIRPYLKKIWFADCSGGTNGDVLVVKSDRDVVLPKFLYYVLASDGFFQYGTQHSKGAKMPRGNKDEILKYTFVLPIKEKQKEIIAILDRFDALCNDLSEGLPAEIEARQKQYEYYRNKLLQF